MVAAKLAQWKEEGKYVGKFAATAITSSVMKDVALLRLISMPTTATLWVIAASALIANGKTGYMSSVRNTTAPGRRVDCRWCAYHNDDEHGTSSR